MTAEPELQPIAGNGIVGWPHRGRVIWPHPRRWVGDIWTIAQA